MSSFCMLFSGCSLPPDATHQRSFRLAKTETERLTTPATLMSSLSFPLPNLLSTSPAAFLTLSSSLMSISTLLSLPSASLSELRSDRMAERASFDDEGREEVATTWREVCASRYRANCKPRPLYPRQKRQ